MHYKNGREAKAGDLVVVPGGKINPPKVGLLHSLNAQSNTCNGRLAALTQNDPWVTLSECLHADDVAAADIPDTTKK